MKYLVEAGVIGVRRCKKEDLRRIAAATGGTLLPNLADLEGGETFDAAQLGRAEEVSEEKVGDGKAREWVILSVSWPCSSRRCASLCASPSVYCRVRLPRVCFAATGELIFIRGTHTSRATTIILRGANEFMLDEMDRSLHDVLCVVKRVLESKSLVRHAHAGCCGEVPLAAPSVCLLVRPELAVGRECSAWCRLCVGLPGGGWRRR